MALLLHMHVITHVWDEHQGATMSLFTPSRPSRSRLSLTCHEPQRLNTRGPDRRPFFITSVTHNALSPVPFGAVYGREGSRG